MSNPDIRGIVNTDLTINGAIDNPKYKLNISSSRVSIKNFKINDVLLDLTGDKEKATLNRLNLDVYKNLIVGNGYYDIKNKTYNVVVKSNGKIDVSKFQSFLTPYGIENAKGKIALNLSLIHISFLISCDNKVHLSSLISEILSIFIYFSILIK